VRVRLELQRAFSKKRESLTKFWSSVECLHQGLFNYTTSGLIQSGETVPVRDVSGYILMQKISPKTSVFHALGITEKLFQKVKGYVTYTPWSWFKRGYKPGLSGRIKKRERTAFITIH
jgi:hypothetical protein